MKTYKIELEITKPEARCLAVSMLKPKWNDAKNCNRLYCSFCGGKLFNKLNK